MQPAAIELSIQGLVLEIAVFPLFPLFNLWTIVVIANESFSGIGVDPGDLNIHPINEIS